MVQTGKAVPLDQEVATAVARLGLDHAATVRLMKAYSNATFHYRFAQVETLSAATIAEQVVLLDDIATFVKNAALYLTEIPPHYGEALARNIRISARLARDVPPTDLLIAVGAALDELSGFLKPPTGRTPHTALERSMRTLLPAIEEATGSQAKIRWNKAKGSAPESGSLATDALLIMLKQLDGRLQDTTIFNMINKVRTTPEKLPLLLG